MFTDDRQALWWSPVAGSFLWCWREAGSPCDGPWWLGASSGTGERQAVPVMVPGGWYCTGGLWEPWLHWYCAGGAVGSPGFAGTVLGGCGEPWLRWYCAGGLWGALASLVLCWGCGKPWLRWYCAGGYGEPWLCWYCAGGLWGALALLVLCWGAVGSPGFTGTVLGAVGSPGFTGTLLGGCGEPWLCWET